MLSDHLLNELKNLIVKKKEDNNIKILEKESNIFEKKSYV